MKTEAQDLIEAARYAVEILGRIPAFGNDIGEDVSKPEIGIAFNRLNIALADLEHTEVRRPHEARGSAASNACYGAY